jgi:RNA polymerase sigma-70 factor, ECF subfamily
MPLTDPSHDLALLDASRTGAAASRSMAFTELYRCHQGPLYRFALLRSGSADTAADIVQEIFLGLMTDAFKFDPSRGALQGFLFGVARNLVLKREGANQRFVSKHSSNDNGNDDSEFDNVMAADPNWEPAEKLLADERAEIVRQALQQVAPHYRDVLILYEMHDLSYVEIAQVCGIDIGTVRSRLSRARSRMMMLLADFHSAGLQPGRPQQQS